VKLTELQREILLAATEEYAGLWVAIFEARAEHPELDVEEIRGAVIDSLDDLLHLGLLEAGDVTADGRGFVPWPLSATQIISRIQAEWDTLGREPNIGDIVWFRATEIGEQAVSAMTG
jgi:hypothetical protein